MTHVLHLTTWHPVVDGVSGIFVLEQCAALQAAGARVGLIFSRIEGLRSATARNFARGLPGFVRTQQPVPTLGFKSWNLPGAAGLVGRFNTWMLGNRYAAYEQSMGRPDILHAHAALEAGPAARRIAARIGREYVVTEHSSEILLARLTPERKAAAREVYADAHRVIAVSSALADRISDICPSARITVVGNLVREAVFALRTREGRVGERLMVVSIGGLDPGKRTAQALEALAGLPAGLRGKIDFHIVGDGPQRARLEALARASELATRFHGKLPHAEAMALLAGADLLVHASSFETFGIVLAEAMALGIPVVATRCGGPEDFVTDRSGLLVPVDDVDALRAAIRQVLEDLETWKSRSSDISADARARFHETAVGAAVMETYPCL